MRNSTQKIGIIVLAAGRSKRLGKPKQLLVFQGETLLERAAKTALASVCHPAIVVLGAKAEKLKQAIENFEIETVENSDWESGMGSSIKIGLKKLIEIQPDVAGAILTVCDQPFVSANLIAKLVENFRTTEALIVACSYGGTLGVPALFIRQFFPELMALKADNGAKKIIYEYKENTIEIPFEAGAIDVDTEQDYLNLLDLENENKR